ncbi:MAG: phosphatidate cytidylyltransferase [Fusobacterium sp. JB021]|nr:phosphatidate cytidylyltransferase [Fusobacterium sp. JB021]
MLNRILVAILGIPLLIYIFYMGGFPLLVFTNGIIGIGLYEFYKMAEDFGNKPYLKIGILTGLTIPNLIYFLSPSESSLILFLPLVFLFILLMALRVIKNEIENTSRDIGITILGIFYVSILFSHILLLGKMPNGGKLILLIQAAVWVCDSAAYFVGMNFGRKFFKEGFSIISPKKSKEGAIGGIIFTMIAVIILNNQFNIIKGNIFLILLLGLIISIVAQIGDLAESMFKREFKIKDSGKLLGEHGGILDRFDSMIFVLPVVYNLLKIFIY